MKKLCIHIYSSYCDYTKNEQRLLWDNEVQKDAQTVRAVFNEHTIVDIPVTAVESKQKRHLDTYGALEPLREIKFADYDECHIVLNTHGAAGVNDLSDEVVKAVVSAVSNHDIKITQISALQCNGLKGLSSDEYRRKNPMTPMHQNVSNKPSSMSILQAKLSALETKIEQSFAIHGFMQAYDPVSESDKVEMLLLHGSTMSLSVKTKLAEEDNLEVKKYIDICSTAEDKSSKEYISATNELGKLMHQMKLNICRHLQGKEDLDERNQTLLSTIRSTSPVNTDTDFEREYKRWVKKHKVSSTERLNVFKAYCPEEEVKEELGQQKGIPASIAALCNGDQGFFTKSASYRDRFVPHLDRNCTF